MRNIQSLKVYLNETTLKDIIAAHMYATTVVADDEEVLEVTLGEIVDGMREIILKRIKMKEAELIVHS